MKYFNSILLGFLELLESLGLLVSLVLATPLRLLQRFDRLYAAFYYLKILLPRGQLAAFIRVQLDAKIGNLLQATNLLDRIVSILEEELSLEGSNKLHRILTDFYALLFRFHILSGNVEDAAVTIIRAQQKMGLDRLPSTPHFDVKVAHVVKAGIAAAKLLEEGGQATLMVRQGEDPVLSKPKRSKGRSKTKLTRQSDGAKIIPFPSPSGV